jgi:hypothetical protein
MILQELSCQIRATVLGLETKTHYSSIFLNHYYLVQNWMVKARYQRFLSIHHEFEIFFNLKSKFIRFNKEDIIIPPLSF